jgi:hypothetical protein
MTKLTTRLIIATFATCAVYFLLVAESNATSVADPGVLQPAATAEQPPVD